MKIKRFNESFDPNYIEVGDFEKTIEVNSPTYGKYFMTKVLTIDFISAGENMKLGPVHDFYSKFRTEMSLFLYLYLFYYKEVVDFYSDLILLNLLLF